MQVILRIIQVIMSKMIPHLILLITIVIRQNEAAKILAVFPTPASSHQTVFRALTHEIAKRGHEVTFITPSPVFIDGAPPKNLKEIDVSNGSVSGWDTKRSNNAIGELYFTKGIQNTLDSMVTIFERQITNPRVKEIIESRQKFDLLLLEGCIRLTSAFSRFFNAPAIKINSLGAILDNDNNFGIPVHPVIFPRSFQHKIYNMTVWDIVSLFQKTLSLNRILKDTAKKEDLMLKRVFGEDFPNVDEFVDNSQMLFLNTFRYWEGNYPMPMSVLTLGGIHLKLAEELPKDLKSYLDSSKRGVIYVSFGTNVITSSLPKDMVSTFKKVFSDLPYDVLWRWDVDELSAAADNVKFVKWVPQADLLRHPNLKLFITQAGLQSTDEAIAACVPLIGIPVLGDQWFNAENYVKHGIGLKLEMNEITEKNLRDAINLVASDDSFRQRVCKLRGLLNDLPQTPMDRMVWWLEYIIKHQSGRHLQAPAANLPLHSYYELELLAITIICVLAFAFVVYCALCYIARFLLKILRDCAEL